MSEETGFKCPKDGNTLSLVYEAEKLSNAIRVSVYYKCPLCGYKRDAERLELQKSEQGIVIRRFLYP